MSAAMETKLANTSDALPSTRESQRRRYLLFSSCSFEGGVEDEKKPVTAELRCQANDLCHRV